MQVDEDAELARAIELSRREFEREEEERRRVEEALLQLEEEERLSRLRSASLVPPPSPFLGMRFVLNVCFYFLVLILCVFCRTSHGNRGATALRKSHGRPSAPRLESFSEQASGEKQSHFFFFFFFKR